MSKLRSAPTPVGPRAGVPGPACSLAFHGTNRPSRPRQITRAPLIIALISLCALCLALFAPIPAQAAFTRPFRYQITGTPSESFAFAGYPESVLRDDGLSVDAAGDVWVNDEGSVSEFDSSGGFLEELAPAVPGRHSPEGLEIERTTGNLYLTTQQLGGGEPEFAVFDDTGSLLQQFSGLFSETSPPPRFAIDNSSEPSAGDLYVSKLYLSQIERFTATGAPADFVNAKGEPVNLPYVSGNMITGTPTLKYYFYPDSIAIDSHGDIYAVASGPFPESHQGIVEFGPSGVFLDAISGEETPGVDGDRREGGWGAKLTGLAVDPVSGDILVGVESGAVDEFDSGGRFRSQITETSEGQPLGGVAQVVVDSKGDLYVNNGDVVAYGPGKILPSVRLAEPTHRTPSGVVLNASVNLEGQPATDCEFEYVTEKAFEENVQAHSGDVGEGFADPSSGGRAACVPGPGGIPEDEKYHRVEAEIGGLTSGVVYRYRLAATTSGVLGGYFATASLAFTAPAAPVVDSASASNVSSEYAELGAQIDPRGAQTSYHLEYDTREYLSGEGPHGVSVPAPDASIGSGGATGSADAAVVREVGPLVPGTVYHFRVVATNAVGVAVGPDRVFATLPSAVAGLPDGRAYELVTPVDKGSATDMFNEANSQPGEFLNSDKGYAAESGEGFLLSASLAAFGPFPSSYENAYRFSRTASDWQMTELASPLLGLQTIRSLVADPADFSEVGLNSLIGSASSATGWAHTTMLGRSGGPYTILHAESPTHASSEEEEERERTELVGASRDLSHVVLESKLHTLAPGAEGQDPGSTALYDYSAGELTLVNVNSSGSLLNRCGALLGQSVIPGTRHNAVSASGAQIVFTAPDPYAVNNGPGCWNGSAENAPQLYARSGGQTIEISAPEAGAPKGGGGYPAEYVGASEDGSRVFFVTNAELTKDDAGIGDRELYEWRSYGTSGCAREKNGCLTRISHGESGTAAADVATVPAVSAEGAAVYFTAYGQLTADATSGGPKLYRYDTATGATAYIATVATGDYPTTVLGDWAPPLALLPSLNWYTTPDGRYLIFASYADLTGYSSAQAPGGDCPSRFASAIPAGSCDEVYRYDAATGSLTCISCNPSGAGPVSDAEFAINAGSETDPADGPVRAISNNGAYAFFATADALVPQDTNGTLDVYEWHEGKVSLISSGTDPAPSFFLGYSPYTTPSGEVIEGGNVFFGTHARLVPQDTDTAGDIYDARICTAESPCIKPPPGATAQCEGDACQRPPSAPIDATPGSLTFSGAGDLLVELLPALPAKTDAQSRAGKLGKALKVCRKDRSKTKRVACEKTARSRDGSAKKAKKASNDRRGK